jgi:hypothetical protein
MSKEAIGRIVRSLLDVLKTGDVNKFEGKKLAKIVKQWRAGLRLFNLKLIFN